MNTSNFLQVINDGYNFKGESIELGGAVLDGQVVPGAMIKIPLKMFNRHGLIAGATGSGKTKTLQILAEQLSLKSVPVLLMDIKGDLSGIAVPGSMHPKIEERHQKIGIPFAPAGVPVELLSLSNEKGVRLRATVTEFGPVLFSKILALNETQSGVVSIIFKYCDDQQLPLLDLDDFKKTLQYVSNEGKKDIEKEYGLVSTATVGSIMRKVVELEQQKADTFFGEPSFEVDDLCRLDEDGRGIVSIIRLTDIQDRPKLFSTFMLQLLAEIYATFPEAGDLDAPKLVIFIDEAHLVFEEASDALQSQLESIIKLIRSKGIGVFFVTQSPSDIPNSVLGQLGMKIQHALRAFTAKDRKDIKLVAENYPLTDFYDIEKVITELGIGEAFVTVLNEKGIPTPLAYTMLRAPQSRMDILSQIEIDSLVARSALIRKYTSDYNRESAYEILSEKIDFAQQEEQQARLREEQQKAREAEMKASRSRSSGRSQKSTFEKVVTSSAGRTIARELTRGLLGVLGIGGKRKLF